MPLVIAAMGINGVQFVHAQTPKTTGDFSAKGYTGQILVLPAGMTSQIPKPAQAMAPPPVGTIIGRNWSFAVRGGELQNFKWDATRYNLNGKVNSILSINSLSIFLLSFFNSL